MVFIGIYYCIIIIIIITIIIITISSILFSAFAFEKPLRWCRYVLVPFSIDAVLTFSN